MLNLRCLYPAASQWAQFVILILQFIKCFNNSRSLATRLCCCVGLLFVPTALIFMIDGCNVGLITRYLASYPPWNAALSLLLELL